MEYICQKGGRGSKTDPESNKEGTRAFPVCDYQEVKGTSVSDPTAKTSYRALELREKIEMVERAASECDPDIGIDILDCATTGKTFPWFEARGIPCGRDMFYDRLRKFFWILDKYRK